MISCEKRIKIFAGNSIKNLAKSTAEGFGMHLSDIDIKKFSDGEIFVTLNENVRNYTCFIFQSTCPPVNDNLMELLVMADALKRDCAQKIVAVMPYFGYSRQERKSRPHDPITAKLVANLISTSGVCEVVTIDLHAPQIEGFFDIPIMHLHGQEILADYIKNSILINKNEYIVVSPDLGSVNRARQFAQFLGDLPVSIVNKTRKKPNECSIMDIIGEVKNKKAIIVDDMVDTAGTLCNVANFLHENGSTEIMACATHGVLSGPAIERINKSAIEKLFILDTIPLAKNEGNKKIEVVSSKTLLMDALKNMVS